MYNRTAYNRTAFNRATGGQQMTGNCRLELRAAGKAYRRMSPVGAAGMSLRAAGIYWRLSVVAMEPVTLGLSVSGQAGRRRYPECLPVAIDLVAAAPGYNAYGTEYIKLPGLVLKPGQELVIDTEAMTVTLNGVNAAELVSMDSDFISLSPGENILVFEDGGQSRAAQIKIEWKPRWL